MPGRRKAMHIPCQGRRQRRGRRLLLRPTLLVILLEGQSHGYQLSERLEDYGFDPDLLDSSVVYRDLRDMEDRGLIDSHWDEESKGPRRRVYRINQTGLACLQSWMNGLQDVRDRIGGLINHYQTLAEEVGEG